jgi:hypothetical protein
MRHYEVTLIRDPSLEDKDARRHPQGSGSPHLWRGVRRGTFRLRIAWKSSSKGRTVHMPTAPTSVVRWHASTPRGRYTGACG